MPNVPVFSRPHLDALAEAVCAVIRKGRQMTPWEKVSEGWAGLVARVQVVETTIAAVRAQILEGVHDLMARLTVAESRVERLLGAEQRKDDRDAKLSARLEALEKQGAVLKDAAESKLQLVDKNLNTIWGELSTMRHQYLTVLDKRLSAVEWHELPRKVKNLDVFQEAQARQGNQHEERLKALETTARAHSMELPSLERWADGLARNLSKLEGRVAAVREHAQRWFDSPVGPSAAATPVSNGIEGVSVLRELTREAVSSSFYTMPEEARSTVQQTGQEALKASQAAQGALGVFRPVWCFPDEGRYWMERADTNDSARVLSRHHNRHTANVHRFPGEMIQKLWDASNAVCPHCQEAIEVDLNGLAVDSDHGRPIHRLCRLRRAAQ